MSPETDGSAFNSGSRRSSGRMRRRRMAAAMPEAGPASVPLIGEPALAQDQHMGRVVLELAQDVGRDDHGHPLLPQPAQGFAPDRPAPRDRGPRPARPAAARGADGRWSRRSPGAGADRARACRPSGPMRSAMARRPAALSAAAACSRPRKAERRRAMQQALAHRELVIKPVAVGQEPHHPVTGPGLAQHVDARDIDRSGERRIQAGDAAQQGRLAGAVGADERGDGLRLQGEGDLVEGSQARIVEDEPADVDHRHHEASPAAGEESVCAPDRATRQPQPAIRSIRAQASHQSGSHPYREPISRSAP